MTTTRRPFAHGRTMGSDAETSTTPAADETVTKRFWKKNAATQGIATTWNRLVTYMFEPEDGECLAALRMVFGLLMLIDTVDERGFCRADERWMEPKKCYFPLFDFVRPLPGRWMCLAYASMFSGVLGVFTGFHYRASCAMYAIPYWYIFLADKSSWNNHSYLFGLLIAIFSVTDAHRNWSMDKWLQPRNDPSSSQQVPRWNYLLLRIQFFVMYFVAGLKKFEPDWLWGYSMMSLGHHHAFTPFRYIFPDEFVDHWIVHVGGFLIDLLSGFGLCFRTTRPLTIVVLLLFHGMNSIMFTIGMFPYVCAAMIPVFCDPATVSRTLRTVAETGRRRRSQADHVVSDGHCTSASTPAVHEELPPRPGRAKRNAIAAAVCTYAVLQLFLPYSHFVTKGYNGWRNGMYGYSWDMMVYNIDVAKIEVKVVDHARREQFFLDPQIWTENSKWVLHGDMMRQFAECVAANMPDRRDNMSVRMDIWGSLNGRFHQRLVDPDADLLHDPWSPWSPVPWLLPLLRHLDRWRPWIVTAKNRTDDDDDDNDLLFFADFPGMTATDLYEDDGRANVTATLAVIEGAVAVRVDDDDGTTAAAAADAVRLVSGEALEVAGRHAVTTVSATPSCYVVYTAAGTTKSVTGNDGRPPPSSATTTTRAPSTCAKDKTVPRTDRRCSNACYAFAWDAVKNVLSAFF